MVKNKLVGRATFKIEPVSLSWRKRHEIAPRKSTSIIDDITNLPRSQSRPHYILIPSGPWQRIANAVPARRKRDDLVWFRRSFDCPFRSAIGKNPITFADLKH
ncbi:MAG: hypothetical protein IKO40_14140, partial [Kiritimatiellae bacterium]|nr:hypothetical protein [Kiritimatiellia bacterium]